MSMIGYLLQVSEKELEEILLDSSVLEEKAFPEDDSSPAGLMDIDKAWEAIFFVLTGHGLAEIDEVNPPLSWLLMSDHVVDEDLDMGYGPAQYITPAEVKLLNSELAKVSNDNFKDRYDGRQLDEAGIYPEIWQEENAMDYAVDYFEQLKAFYALASEKGNAVITFIS